MSRRRRWAGLLVVLLGSLAATIAAAADNSLEYAVKATYLYKFGPFVRWPDSAFAAPSSPFNLCILGRDPFGAQLDHIVAGEQFGGHAITVRRIETAPAPAECHVLYINAPAAIAANALQRVKGMPVLTVTEIEHAQAATGIINFVIQDNRVRFEIDNRSAAENDLVLSSKLLRLASSVTPNNAENAP